MKPKIALVHDYLNEFGGAERVLLAFSEIYPDAPIYTAFYKLGSPAWERFKNKDLRVSWVQRIPFFAKYLHSPLRFLAPLIWNRFDFQKYDIVIGSASWYITKGFRKKAQAGRQTKTGATIEICYCHTPPRWLYGYKTSIEWQRFFLVRIYGQIVSHFMRLYDFYAAQRVDQFVANSNNTAKRIQKFYRRKAKVIYPPVELQPLTEKQLEAIKRAPAYKNYYLVISRIVGGKGLDLAVKTAVKLGIKLKIAGEPAGYSNELKKLQRLAHGQVEFLGHVSDLNLSILYAGAKGFLALAEDEDFGITVVESMAAGTPVIAYHGGGYLESVVHGQTGLFFDELTVESLSEAIQRFEKTEFLPSKIKQHAEQFSKKTFQAKIQAIVNEYLA